MNIRKNTVIILVMALMFSVVAVMLLGKVTGNKAENKIEIMDLTGDITPYQAMTYGDSYIADLVFDSILRIKDYTVTPGIATEYTVDGSKITVEISDVSFKIPGGDRKLTTDDIVDYYTNILIRLNESNSIANPGIANLSSIVKLDDKKVEFNFNSESANNLIALAEKIGYIHENNWYGTLENVEYNNTEVKVGKEIYVPLSSEKGLTVNKRISNMMVANVMADETVNLTKIPNDSYGFITWGSESQISDDNRQAIFGALEESQIRKNISIPSDGVYSGSELHIKTDITKLGSIEDISQAGLSDGVSLKIGIVSLGSFKEVKNALTESFNNIGVPAAIEELELNDLMVSDEYDLIYVRIARGMSPNITALFNEGNLLAGYSEQYTNEIKEINESKTWEELCELSKDLDLKLRENGVWLFIDEAYNVETTKK